MTNRELEKMKARQRKEEVRAIWKIGEVLKTSDLAERLKHSHSNASLRHSMNCMIAAHEVVKHSPDNTRPVTFRRIAKYDWAENDPGLDLSLLPDWFGQVGQVNQDHCRHVVFG